MKKTLFVSYRRDDSADVAGRIYDRLAQAFGKETIFKDVDDIPFGVDFRQYLAAAVGQCNVLLAVIGRQWLTITDSRGNRRLDDPADFVRIEIESALKRGIPVIPLLVQEASMPRTENLPPSLKELCYRNGLPIRRDPDFHKDMNRLIEQLSKYLSSVREEVKGIRTEEQQVSTPGFQTRQSILQRYAEVDLSGKIESTNEPTVICLKNGINYSILVEGKTKEKILSTLRASKPGRSQTKHRVLFYSTLLFYLLKDKITHLDQIVIDNEYTGYDTNIKEHILNLFSNHNMIIHPEKILIKTLSKNSSAYRSAKEVRMKKTLPNRTISADEILEELNIK